MTARQKLSAFRVAQYVLLAAALALTILLILKGDVGTGSRVLVCALVCVAAAGLQAHYLIHELGHLLFGLLSGFRPVSFSVACVRFSRIGKKVSFVPNAAYAGACEMYPVGETRLKGRILLYTMGGVIFNFIFAVTGILCFLLLPASWGLLFFVSLAPLNLFECVTELLPVQLSAGKTDGKFALDLIKGESGARNAYAVFHAQSLLSKGSFSDVPRAVLYDVPVVREDDPVFLSLLSLRMMRAQLTGEREEALICAKRLSELKEYLPPEQAKELAADCACVYFLNGEEKSARALLPEDGKREDLAVLRARRLLSEEGTAADDLTAWKKAKQKLPMRGQREWEDYFLKYICADRHPKTGEGE